ncbi:Rieske (2Fe-2S) protein [Blastomonas fulva]|jgi:nitrite reductase (NADH) small subunit|uniref:Rieske (2Fe-2S) protein n=1 Tax=Blastomonas fulva TaxID=1550728 RepID=UPI003F6E9190
MQSKEYRIGSLAAVQAGEAILSEANGQDVALFMCQGKVIATNGQCPHAEGPLHEGEVEGTILTCPWHGWTFDLESGACQEDDTIMLERYPVRIDGDDVLVTL